MSFPYIKSLHVNDCYAYQNFDIDTGVKKEDTFKHIILTGKNGSGKTTILNRIDFVIKNYQLDGSKDQQEKIEYQKSFLQDRTYFGIDEQRSLEVQNTLIQWNSVILNFNIKDRNNASKYLFESINYIFTYFTSINRELRLKEVNTVTKDRDFDFILRKRQNLSNRDLVGQFKQYLVNKKVYQAFAQLDNNSEEVKQNEMFFKYFTEKLREIFHESNLELEFEKENFEFYLKLSEDRKMTFNQLSDGFSAFLNIIMALLLQTDLIRKAMKDNTYEPQGIVLIDEPETHCHLSMQYEALPIITSMFPRLQLIVATHSPAVISSIDNAIVFDLTNKEIVTTPLLGSSYSELMLSHFGLKNEFSPFADKLITQIDKAILENNLAELKRIFIDNEKYFSPSLKLEIENRIIYLESKKK